MSFALAAEQILWDRDYAVRSFWLPPKNTNGQRKVFLRLHYANVLEDKVHVYLMRNKAALSHFGVRDRAWSAVKKKNRPPATLKVIRHVCRHRVFGVEIKSSCYSKIHELNTGPNCNLRATQFFITWYCDSVINGQVFTYTIRPCLPWMATAPGNLLPSWIIAKNTPVCNHEDLD